MPYDQHLARLRDHASRTSVFADWAVDAFLTAQTPAQIRAAEAAMFGALHAAEQAAATLRRALNAGVHHYFATACGHKHQSASAAGKCWNRGYDHTQRGPYPVVEVFIRPGRITRTVVHPDAA